MKGFEAICKCVDALFCFPCQENFIIPCVATIYKGSASLLWSNDNLQGIISIRCKPKMRCRNFFLFSFTFFSFSFESLNHICIKKSTQSLSQTFVHQSYMGPRFTYNYLVSPTNLNHVSALAHFFNTIFHLNKFWHLNTFLLLNTFSHHNTFFHLNTFSHLNTLSPRGNVIWF